LPILTGITAPSGAKFEYSDKVHSKDIRLLQIRPGGAGDTINLSICTTPVDSVPAYIALSYTWGDPRSTCPVICDGKELHVTQNLKEALWQLRHAQSQHKFEGPFSMWSGHHGLPYFWIDAICINQSDDDEKSHQVALMWEIYSRAELVIAWLGKQTEITKRGMELIRRLNSVIGLNEAGAGPGDGQKYQKIRFTELATLGLPELASPAWNDLFSVFSRDWFNRVWVIQELVAARTCLFLCGDEFVDSSIFLRVGEIIDESKLLSSIRNFERSRILAINIGFLAYLKSKEKHDFNTLLWSTHLFKASDQRDRIFSLVHMACGLKSNFVSDLIDYRLSVPEVLTKYARISLAQGSLDVLCYAQALGDLYSLPSWVPYWTAPDYCYTPLIKSWGASTQMQIVGTASQGYQIEPNDVSGIAAIRAYSSQRLISKLLVTGTGIKR
jgi:Heterokaryon incompatibility protein (HET)